MDVFGILLAVGFVLLVLFGPWVLALRANSARRREREEDQARWRELTSRIFTLENAVEALQARRADPAAKSVEPGKAERPEPARYEAPAFSIEQPVRPGVEPIPDPSPSARVAHDWVARKTAEPVSESDTGAPSAALPIPPLPPSVTPEPQAANGKELHFSFADKVKSSLDIEEMLGTNWLNKLGIVHLGAGHRVLSCLPTQDARSRGQSSRGIRDRCRHAGRGNLVRPERALPDSGARWNRRRMGAGVLHRLRHVPRSSGAGAFIASRRLGAHAGGGGGDGCPHSALSLAGSDRDWHFCSRF